MPVGYETVTRWFFPGNMKWNCSGTTIDVPFTYFMIHLSMSVNCPWIAFTKRFCTLQSTRENISKVEQWLWIIFSHSCELYNTQMHVWPGQMTALFQCFCSHRKRQSPTVPYSKLVCTQKRVPSDSVLPNAATLLSASETQSVWAFAKIKIKYMTKCFLFLHFIHSI